MFSQLNVILGKVISSSANTYPYRSIFEKLLNYGKEAGRSHLSLSLFTKDIAKHLEELNPTKLNVGLNTRDGWTKKSKMVEVLGRLHSDIFSQGRYLLNGLSLRLVLHRQKDRFALLSNADNASFKIKIVVAVLFARKSVLSADKFRSIQQKLERHSIYPINRVVMTTRSVASGLSTINWDNAIMGQLPNKVIVGMVDNETYIGSYKRNPFNFKHNDLSSIDLYVNGQSKPGRPIKLNFSSDEYMEGYLSLFASTGKFNQDEGLIITRGDYKGGYSLFAFDISPALCNGRHQEIARKGTVQLELEFSKPLTNTITLLLYSEFDNVITVDRYRNVLKNF